MIVLGIDPGTQRIGYGVVQRSGNAYTFVDAGLLAVSNRSAEETLRDIKRGTDTLLEKHTPKALAIERLYFSKNQKTALRVAEARGVILLAAVEHGVPVVEYGPNEVKASMTGYGGADKRAVLKMVRLTLRMPALDVADDASDALALALVAAQDRRLRNAS